MPPAGAGWRCATIFHYFSGNRGQFYPMSPSPINSTIRDGRSEPENLHDNSQRDLWSGSAVPCVANFLWLAGRNRRLDGADVVKLDRSRRHRRLELLRNKPRHA